MKIAIFGLARSGISAFNYLVKKTNHEVYLVNQGNPKDWSCYDYIKDLITLERCYDQTMAIDLFEQVDQIILSPGIPRTHTSLVKAINKNVDIISEIEFAFRHSDIPVIAITGTNGKTTTTTMIGEFLDKNHINAFTCGNIGRPYSDLLLEKKSYDYAIVEVSSFQLESIVEFKPKISIVLKITSNHAERYADFESYKMAKYEIFKNQDENDYTLIHPDHLEQQLQAKKILIKPLLQFDYSKSFLKGEHNKENFYCAYQIGKLLNISQLENRFQDFINHFSGVEFRLQYIGRFKQLIIYNDGKSTNDEATIAAIESFKDEDNDIYLALGGQPRGNALTLDKKLKGKEIKKVFAFGEAKSLIKENLDECFDIIEFNGLSDMFEYIKGAKLKGVLLFSPAFPSFDQYKNYEFRAKHFTELAQELMG